MAEPTEGNAPNNGSTDNGTQRPGNVDSLKNVFAGADGTKPESKPNGDKGKGDDGSGGARNDDQITLGPWAQHLPPEIRENPEAAKTLAKFPKVGDMAKAYLELEGKLAAGTIPLKDASAEELASFWEKVGKPKTYEGYSFAKDKENRGDVFAQASLEANLTTTQAATLYKALGDLGAKRVQEAKDTQERQFKETEAALEKEYGSRWPEKVELLKRGLIAAGPHVGSLLAQAGLSGNPEIIKAFIAFGQMTQESGAARGDGAGSTLKSVMEGGTFDYKTEEG